MIPDSRIEQFSMPGYFAVTNISKYHTAQPTVDIPQFGNNNALCNSFRVFTFCLTGYQSAQFLRRAMHCVSANR